MDASKKRTEADVSRLARDFAADHAVVGEGCHAREAGVLRLWCGGVWKAPAGSSGVAGGGRPVQWDDPGAGGVVAATRHTGRQAGAAHLPHGGVGRGGGGEVLLV